MEWRMPPHRTLSQSWSKKCNSICFLFGDVVHHSVNTASFTLHRLYNPTESTNMDET